MITIHRRDRHAGIAYVLDEITCKKNGNLWKTFFHALHECGKDLCFKLSLFSFKTIPMYF